MFKALSVNALLKSVIAGLAAVIVLMLAYGTWQSWNRLVVANRIAAVSDATGHLFTAQHNLRLDRTGSYRDLVADRVLTAINPQVKQVREAEMPALRAALATLRDVDLPDRDSVVKDLGAAIDRLAALQAESVPAMMKPKAERRPGIAQDYMKATTQLFEMAERLSARLTDFVKLQDPLVDQLLVVKQLAWDLRNIGGDASLLISGTLGGQKLPPDAVAKHQAYLTQSEIMWKTLRKAAEGLPLPPSFAAAVEKAGKDFFDRDYLALRTRLVAALAAGEKVDFTAEKWLTISPPRLATVLGPAEVALEVAKDHSVRQRTEAMWAMALQIGMLGAAAMLALIMMFMVSRRVTTPLLTIKDAMLKLAGGDLTAEVTFAGRKDEIGASPAPCRSSRTA